MRPLDESLCNHLPGGPKVRPNDARKPWCLAAVREIVRCAIFVFFCGMSAGRHEPSYSSVLVGIVSRLFSPLPQNYISTAVILLLWPPFLPGVCMQIHRNLFPDKHVPGFGAAHSSLWEALRERVALPMMDVLEQMLCLPRGERLVGLSVIFARPIRVTETWQLASNRRTFV